MRITQWGQELSSGDTNEILLELASAHAARLSSACPDRERVHRLINDGRILDLCGLELAYPELTVQDSINLRQIRAFFEKRSDLDAGIDRRAVAKEKFKESEELCRQTNELFEKRAAGSVCLPNRVERVLYSAQRKIASILGDVPEFDKLKFRFGPGATTQVKRRMASARRKLSQTLACSEDLVPVVRQVLEQLPGLVFDESSGDTALVPVEIHSGKLVFVRKNYKTDRSVVVEPYLNGFVQLGIGDYISDRLRRAGLDIRDQHPNQVLAKEGSLTGALATLDLSSASDTIATQLVLELLPFDWFDFLSYFRTSSVTGVDKEPLKLQKFSSMGNGFTFPLETLIFYALAKACAEECESVGPVRAYGDDIIVPTSAYDLTVEVLTTVGFIPNREKSFSSGPFRESCGADYLSGIDIRPCYIKQALVGADLFRLHNFYVRQLESELASLVLKFIDPSIRKYGPDGYGDGHLVRDGSVRPYKRHVGWAGYVFETYTWRARKDFQVLPGDRVYPSYSIYANGTGDLPAHEHDRKGRFGVSIPGVKGVKLISVYTLAP